MDWSSNFVIFNGTKGAILGWTITRRDLDTKRSVVTIWPISSGRRLYRATFKKELISIICFLWSLFHFFPLIADDWLPFPIIQSLKIFNFLNRHVWCWNDIILLETCPHLQHKPLLRTIASFSWKNDHWYFQVDGDVYPGVVCLWMWFESAFMVLCWSWKARML